jgi:hypothetical protein
MAAMVLGLAGLAAFAGTCVVRNVSLTTVGNVKVGAGELRNDSGADLLDHRIAVAFFDSNNQLVSLQTVPGCLRSLQDGTSDFFSATTDQPAVSMLARISFDSTLEAGAVVDGDFTISGVTALRTGESLAVSGTVRNNSDHTVTEPHACAVVYDQDGHVVATASDTAIEDLSQNESQNFTVDVAVPDSTTLVDHVDIWMDALDGGTPIEPQSSKGHDVAVCPTVTPTQGTPTETPTGSATPTPTPSATPSDTPTATATPDGC